MSDTIARLAALRARPAFPAADIGFRDRLAVLNRFGSNPGSLNAKFYAPDNLPDAAPLVVVLHGCTQNAGGYDHHSGWSQLADEAGFALLYPEQQIGNNSNHCFNWFQSVDVTRDSGEALSIRQMIDAMVEAHGLDRRRVFVTGLSAGGAMAASMLAVYPEVFAGGAIIAGLPFGSASTVPQAFDRMRGQGGPSGEDLQRLLGDASDHNGPWPKITIWHGTGDHTVVPSNALAIAGQWKAVHEVGAMPTTSRASGNRTTQVWRNPDGEPVIEVNMIAGMGHGTPIHRDLGAPGPYMLEVGVSSTREIARFWSIDAVEGNFAAAEPTISYTSRSAIPRQADDAGVSMTTSLGPQFPRPHDPDTTPGVSGVKKIIEDALRSAGLLR